MSTPWYRRSSRTRRRLRPSATSCFGVSPRKVEARRACLTPCISSRFQHRSVRAARFRLPRSSSLALVIDRTSFCHFCISGAVSCSQSNRSNLSSSGEDAMPADSNKVISDLRALRALTADDHGAQRIAWSPTWLKARAWFRSKLEGLPFEHHYDAAGNSWTTLKGDSDRTLILGSHLDSVPNGGWLDGCLGVLAGLEILRGFAEGV